MTLPRRKRAFRVLACAWLWAAITSGGVLAAQEPAAGSSAPPDSAEPGDGSEIRLPKLEDLQPPTLERLLDGPARDWVVLTTNEVVVSEPISPRPNTLDRLDEAYREKEKERRGKTGAELERWKKEYDDLRFVYVSMPGPPAREFRISRTKIDHIVHHEDHILAKIDSLLAERNVEIANELLVRFERQWPDWPGLVDRRYSLIATDARNRLEQGDPEAALVLVEELHSQQPEFAGASDLAGQAVEQLVTAAQQQDNPQRGRHFLIRLDSLFPGHPVFQKLSGVYATQATELMSQSLAAGEARDYARAADLAEKSVQVWPRLVSLKPGHKKATERYQRLRVGVVRLTGSPKATPFDGEAEVRARRISENRLFEVDDFRGGIPHYRTSYLDEWEPFDLGRRMRFTLTQTRQPWEAQPRLGAAALTALLEQQLDPGSPSYDERLASDVASVTLESPFEFSLTFSRIPVRIEPILKNATAGPLERESPAAENPAGAGESSPDGAPSATEADQSPVGGFPIVHAEEDETVYRRFRTEPENLQQYRVAEVIEHRYPTYERAYQGLRWGEVWMLPDLPDWILRRVQKDRSFEKDFFIQKYATPTTHVLQFNPRSRALGFRELRRALLHAINRSQLLAEVVLRDPQMDANQTQLAALRKERGDSDPQVLALEKTVREARLATHARVVDTPFPSFSYANSTQLVPQGFDLSASVAMTIAVSNRMGGQIPPLRLAVPPEPVPQEVSEKLLTAWRRVGLEVVQVEAGSADAAGWDIAYRTLQMDEPIVDLWPFLTVQDRARVEDLTPFPDWLKQELITLDRTSDWTRAVEQVQTLHRHLWADVRYIPLWEVDSFMVYRKQVRGVPTDPLHCYEQLDRWNLEDWYATEVP